MVDARELRESRKWCESFCRRSKSSFFYSFALLDRPRRQAMHALYAFARITDDLGDRQEPVDRRAAKLARWRELLDENLSGLVASEQGRQAWGLQQYHLCWPALADCVARYRIPTRLLEDLVRGVAMDVEFAPLNNWQELRHYCYLVASTVGLACAHIWRANEEIPEQSAIDCGVAFQLTNILRDIAVDARLGRIYLPLSELEACNVDVECWLAARPDGRWQDAIDQVAAEARWLYSSGWQTIYALTPHSQRTFSLMWHSYRSLLEQIVADKQKLWGERRIRLPRRQRLGFFIMHLMPTFLSRIPPTGTSHCLPSPVQ